MELDRGKFAYFRKISGLSYSEIGVALGCDTQTIIMWETGGSKIPLEVHDATAKLFGIPIEAFLPGKTDNRHIEKLKQRYIANNLHLLSDHELLKLVRVLAKRSPPRESFPMDWLKHVSEETKEIPRQFIDYLVEMNSRECLDSLRDECELALFESIKSFGEPATDEIIKEFRKRQRIRTKLPRVNRPADDEGD